MKHGIKVIAACLLGASSLAAVAKAPDKAKMDAFINELMGKMTIDEKIGQLNLPVSGILTGDAVSQNVAANIRNGSTGGVFGVKGAEEVRKMQKIAVEESRLGIPLIFGLDVIHGYETTFPIPLAQASTWNRDLIREAAAASAREASASGLSWTFSPMLDVCRDPRWGRIAEGTGEDPYLGGEVAKAMVKGYQGDDLSDPETVMACVKHYALYGAPEGGRDYNTVDMSRQQALNEYMNPYKAAVEAGAGSIMSSFNTYEGIPATAHKWLLTDVLRDRWGFDGFVVTDYASIDEIRMHGVADLAEASAASLAAGTDMDMVTDGFRRTLRKSLEDGKVTQKQIDDACRRILEAKYKLGLFDDPYRYCDAKREKKEVYSAANRKLAREMGAETFVLLKNQDDILPLAKGRKIALIGPLGNSADNMPGMWSVPDTKAKPVSLYEGMKSVYGNDVKFAKGCNALLDDNLEKSLSPASGLDRDGRSAEQMRAEALALAKESDVIVAAMGELMNMTGEGASRADITIPEPQRSLLDELVATGKPVVLVLFTGRPLVLTDVAPKVDAILNVWFAGSEAGDAIADVISGKEVPSGKLTASFPWHVGQVPVHYNHRNTGRPSGYHAPYVKYRSNYQDIPNEPFYPFGYGLSYTTFEYSDPVLDKTVITPGETATVSVNVTNTGKRTAKETVQMYIHDVMASMSRPVMELKGFEKIELKPGETKTVSFPITSETLGFYNNDLEFVCEPGDFEIMTGPSSENTRKLTLTVK